MRRRGRAPARGISRPARRAGTRVVDHSGHTSGLEAFIPPASRDPNDRCRTSPTSPGSGAPKTYEHRPSGRFRRCLRRPPCSRLTLRGICHGGCRGLGGGGGGGESRLLSGPARCGSADPFRDSHCNFSFILPPAVSTSTPLPCRDARRLAFVAADARPAAAVDPRAYAATSRAWRIRTKRSEALLSADGNEVRFFRRDSSTFAASGCAVTVICESALAPAERESRQRDLFSPLNGHHALARRRRTSATADHARTARRGDASLSPHSCPTASFHLLCPSRERGLYAGSWYPVRITFVRIRSALPPAPRDGQASQCKAVCCMSAIRAHLACIRSGDAAGSGRPITIVQDVDYDLGQAAFTIATHPRLRANQHRPLASLRVDREEPGGSSRHRPPFRTITSPRHRRSRSISVTRKLTAFARRCAERRQPYARHLLRRDPLVA